MRRIQAHVERLGADVIPLSLLNVCSATGAGRGKKAVYIKHVGSTIRVVWGRPEAITDRY